MASFVNNLYFKENEFDSPDVKGSGVNMDQEFISKLSLARAMAGIPFTINSGYRSVAHNIKVCGKLKSAHLTGNAADIRALTSMTKFIVIKALLQAGFVRFGIYSRFIHVDNCKDKIQNAIWTYKNFIEP